MLYVIGILIGIFLMNAGPIALSFWWSSYTEVTVKSLDHKLMGKTDKYLVFTEEGVFENTDDWWFFKWDSSDVQNGLKPGKRFKVRYAGIRWPFFSWYPNIISAEEIKAEK